MSFRKKEGAIEEELNKDMRSEKLYTEDSSIRVVSADLVGCVFNAAGKRPGAISVSTWSHFQYKMGK